MRSVRYMFRKFGMDLRRGARCSRHFTPPTNFGAVIESPLASSEDSLLVVARSMSKVSAALVSWSWASSSTALLVEGLGLIHGHGKAVLAASCLDLMGCCLRQQPISCCSLHTKRKVFKGTVARDGFLARLLVGDLEEKLILGLGQLLCKISANMCEPNWRQHLASLSVNREGTQSHKASTETVLSFTKCQWRRRLVSLSINGNSAQFGLKSSRNTKNIFFNKPLMIRKITFF